MEELLFMLSKGRYIKDYIIFETYQKDVDLYILTLKFLNGSKCVKKQNYSTVSIKQLAWMIDNKASYYESIGYNSRPFNMIDYKHILKELNK